MLLRRAARVPGWSWAVLAAVLFGLGQLPAAPSKLTPDSAAYLMQTLDLLGRTPAEARAETITAFCAGYRAERVVNLAPSGPVSAGYGARRESDCVARLTREGQADTTNRYGPAITEGTQIPSPRYEAIFLSRPGTAVVFAPLVGMAGPLCGMWLTVLTCTLAASLLVYLVLRTLGLGRPAAVLGQVLYLVLPTGEWSMYLLSEAPALVLTVVLLLGVTYVVKERPGLGTGLITAAFLAGMFVKYSQFLLIAAGLAAMALVAAIVHRRFDRPVLIVGGLALLWIPLLLAVSALMNWPGGAESIQDLLTGHYAEPDVADPVHQLLRLNVYFWSWWLVQQLTAPLLLVSWAAAAGILRWTRTPIWWAVTAIFLSALATQAGHPVASQGDRLYVGAWLLVVVAVPLLADKMTNRPGSPARSADDAAVLPRQRTATDHRLDGPRTVAGPDQRRSAPAG